MEVILAMPSLDRAQDLVVSLTMQGITVRGLCSTGADLVGHVARAPVDGVVLCEELPDGSADAHLRQLLAIPGRRPVAVVLAYRDEGREALREKVRTTYGLAADLAMAGSRSGSDVAQELARVLERLHRTIQDQDQDAHERLSRPVAGTGLPVPVRRSGLIGFAGTSGGVGTTTLVANLAGIAAASGLRVLLVDAHLHTGPGLLYQLGARGQDTPEAPGVHELRHDFEAHRGEPSVGAVDRVRETVIQVQLPRLQHAALHVLQVPNEMQNRAELSAALLLWAVYVLMQSREYDTILMDSGTGVGDGRTVKLLQACSDVFLVGANRGASLNALFKVSAFRASLDLRTQPYLVLRFYEDSHYSEKFVHSMTKLTVAGVLPHEVALEKREGRQYNDAPPLAVTDTESPYAQAVRSLGLHLGLVEQVGKPAHDGKRSRGFFRLGRR